MPSHDFEMISIYPVVPVSIALILIIIAAVTANKDDEWSLRLTIGAFALLFAGSLLHLFIDRQKEKSTKDSKELLIANNNKLPDNSLRMGRNLKLVAASTAFVLIILAAVIADKNYELGINLLTISTLILFSLCSFFLIRERVPEKANEQENYAG